MNCKQLGGACDQEFRAETFEEMVDLSKKHGMEIIMGDAQSDGMGLMKSGYAVGMKADLPSYVLMDYGDIYGSAIATTGKCLADKFNIKAVKDFLSSN